MRRALLLALVLVAACRSTEGAAPQQALATTSAPLSSTTAATTSAPLSSTSAVSPDTLPITDFTNLLRFAHEANVRPGATRHVVGTCRWPGMDHVLVSFGALGRPVAHGEAASTPTETSPSTSPYPPIWNQASTR